MIHEIDHWANFKHFAEQEKHAGGPEPELPPVTYMGRMADPVERVWFAGIYCSHHCVPSALAIWKNFRAHEVVLDETRFYNWLQENWRYLPVRKEMRSHRMVHKRHQCLVDFASYALLKSWESGDYEKIWHESQDRVKYFGRYVAIKYLELLRQSVRPDLVMPDIRAKGAWSPRETLAMLFPEHRQKMMDRNDNSKSTVELAETLAAEVASRTGLTNFQLQVLLCEYKQHLRGTFYPGVSHDEELEFTRIVEQKFPMGAFYEARKVLFKTEYLGEIGGWDGIRKEKFHAAKKSR